MLKERMLQTKQTGHLDKIARTEYHSTPKHKQNMS